MLKSHEYPLTFMHMGTRVCMPYVVRLAGPASPTDLIGNQTHGRFGFSIRLDMHLI